MEYLEIGKGMCHGYRHHVTGPIAEMWVVDGEQMEPFMDEYECSSDRQQLLKDRKKQLVAIHRVRLMCFSFYFVSLIHS